MTDITRTPADVYLPNELQASLVRGTLGAAVELGQAVYLDGNNGWKKGDADAAASGQVRGVLVGLPNGGTTGASGDPCDIVTRGRIGGYASMTPGGAVFVSTNAGEMDQTAPPDSGEYIFAIGWAMSASILFVDPQITVPTANAS